MAEGGGDNFSVLSRPLVQERSVCLKTVNMAVQASVETDLVPAHNSALRGLRDQCVFNTSCKPASAYSGLYKHRILERLYNCEGVQS